ncbi:MAG: hypothetical protein ONB05_06425, partial [candidate division KSB1 bacterium]|nr:hypothetical protein [candidate division KSB1 bacterium]
TTYPVPYEIWLKKNGEVAIRPQKAKPANSADLTSSWVVLTPELHRTQFMEGRGPYEIRHGLKHDVAEILIVQPVERQGHQLIIEQTNNLRERYEIETEVIYPFLQPRHLHKWKIGGNTYVIIPQQKAGEDNEKELEKKLPLTYSYLKHFEAHFTKRRSRLFSNGPFYGLLGLGDYTWKPDEVFKTSCVYRFGKSNNLNRREGQNFG